MDTISSDRMIFYNDHSLEFVSGNEIIQKASWSSDKLYKTIIITDAETKESAQMKIIVLNKSNCTFENKDKSGAIIKMYMVTDK